jgi:hypothetical protein
MCWGKFTSQNTRAVDQYDPMVSGALETQWALASTPFNTLNPTGNVSNTMSYGGSSTPTNSAPVENRTQTMDKAAKQAQKEAAKATRDALKAQKAAAKEAAKAQKAQAKAIKCSGDVCKSCS